MRFRRPARATSIHTAWPAAWPAAALFASAAVLAAASPRDGAAQVVTVDEGSFTVSRGGTALGREEFRIVRQPGAGAVVMARATGTYGDRRVTAALQADAAGAPERYQLEVRRGSRVEQRVSAQAAGTHFRAQSQGETGEAARELLLEPGTVVVDDEVYHQYYFLVRRADAAGAATRVPTLVPRRGTQTPLWVTVDGSERVMVGGQAVAARHLVVTDRAGDRREVWADAQGRVLRVVLPAEGIEAIRSDVPR